MPKTEASRLRRIASEAQRTYVGGHWPTMAAMRRDGISTHLVEDRAHERLIRRFLYEFQPEFILQGIDAIEAEARAATLAEVRAAIWAIPSEAMDTLVPNTGPDVIARDKVFAALDDLAGKG